MASIGAYVDLVPPTRSLRHDCMGASLYAEVWEPASVASGTLFHSHGVCESNETVTVQRLARACLDQGWRLISLEHEGHGLSSGARGVCEDFDRLVALFGDFVATQLEEMGRPARAGERWALSGHSMGAVVALYAAAKRPTDDDAGFRGVVLLAPAVGVDPRAMPPSVVVGALRLASYFAPESNFGLTPREDPNSYAAPPDSERNFRGFWPLATSKMLLDVTTSRVTDDLTSGALNINFPLLCIHGRRDAVVPFKAVQRFVAAAGLDAEKSLVAIPKVGHDLVVDPSTGSTVCQRALAWLEDR